MKLEHINKLADFELIPLKKLPKSLFLSQVSHGFFEFEDVFGEAPAQVYYYQGDVHLTEEVVLDKPQGFAYAVIDGDLKIDGLLSLEVWDVYQVLIITGTLEVDHLLLSYEAFLGVLGAVKVKGVVYNRTADGGACLLPEKVTAATMIRASHGDYDRLNDAAPPLAIVGKEALHDHYQEAKFEQILEALRQGEKITKV